jgi:CRP-like cAMP-binding protein
MDRSLGSTLAAHPFFHDMDPVALGTIVSCAGNSIFQPGETIFRQGEAADKCYLVREGRIGLEIHVPGRQSGISIETVEAGEIVGWGWITPPYRWSTDARATETTRVLQLDATCLRRKMEDDRTLGYEIYRRFVPVMASRLAAYRSRIVELATEPEARNA